MSNNGPNIGLEEMRTFVIEALRYFNTKSDNTTYYPDIKTTDNLNNKTAEMIFQKYPDSYERFPNDKVDKRLNMHNTNNFLQVLNSLYSEGVIMRGNAGDRDRTSEPYFSITTYGKKVLEATEGEIVPHDPDNYITNLKKRIEGLDSLVFMYLQESLECHYLASSVMLGVASEATLIYCLIGCWKRIM